MEREPKTTTTETEWVYVAEGGSPRPPEKSPKVSKPKPAVKPPLPPRK